VRSDSLVLVGRSHKASKVVEQKENPVTPGLERVQSVLEDREGFNLPEKFEVCAGDAIGIFGNYLNTYYPEQVGPKGTMLPLASRDSVFGCRVMVVG
jgi:hypothetical protein